ncbi:hypothetical protein [Paenibacillus cymbidii]|uniref:hypothetical protein n=1 Tax=Paenibacillus cymbidii TaxID=1639034 RepID=UPI001436B8C3|nr:hypothetical protein [Paenibacillus cymbidii]
MSVGMRPAGGRKAKKPQREKSAAASSHQGLESAIAAARRLCYHGINEGWSDACHAL